MGKKTIISKALAKTSGYQKLLISLLLAVCATLATLMLHISIFTRIILCWDVFAVSMIIMMWVLFLTTTADEQRQIVKAQDDDIAVIFGIILTAVCVSFIGTLLIFSTNLSVVDKEIRTVVTFVAIMASWILLHTIFVVRYAHLYHDATIIKTGKGSGGIDFPDTEAPDYIDMAYFSFVIGMTFQVSDVTISSKTIRRYVLLHSLISFVFNTVIVALTVNILAGLSQ